MPENKNHMKFFHFSLREEITEFAENLLDWLDESLTEAPMALKEAKFEGECDLSCMMVIFSKTK